MSKLLSAREGTVFGFMVSALSVVGEFFNKCASEVELASSGQVEYSDEGICEFHFRGFAMGEFVIEDIFAETFGGFGDFGVDEGESPADAGERGSWVFWG